MKNIHSPFQTAEFAQKPPRTSKIDSIENHTQGHNSVPYALNLPVYKNGFHSACNCLMLWQSDVQ